MKIVYASEEEIETYKRIRQKMEEAPIPPEDLLANLPLYLTRPNLSHILFVDKVYRQILNVHGSIVEFGCGYGRNLALFAELRNIYEPYNASRRIFGIDTFSGHANIEEIDGIHLDKGDCAVPDSYIKYLMELLNDHINLSPRQRGMWVSLIKQDIRFITEVGIPDVIALAYIDVNLYSPTASAIHILKKQMVGGGVVVLDEINCHEAPGETRAFLKELGPGIRLQRDPSSHFRCYFLWE